MEVSLLSKFEFKNQVTMIGGGGGGGHESTWVLGCPEDRKWLEGGE